MSFKNKTKFALWVYPQTLNDVENHYRFDNCRSQSEFIERAIKFYIGYLDEKKRRQLYLSDDHGNSQS